MATFKETAGGLDKKIYSVYLAVKRPDTPLYAKIACGMLVWYALSPLDLIPDFVPVLGAVDDIVILPLLMWLSVKLIPETILKECLTEAENMNTHNKKELLRYSLPVITIWAILAFWLVQTVVKYIPMPL